MRNNNGFFSSWLGIVLIILFALLLRLPFLDGSFWLDEAAQALESVRPLSQQLHIRDDFQPPLLHVLVHFATYFGQAEWWLRTIGALIPGLITVYFTYKIGNLLANRNVGYISSLLLATSSFHIYYSQELRQYSLPAAFAIITWYLLLKSWKKNTVPNTKILVLFALVTVAGMYTSYLYPFAVISQVVWLVTACREHISKWGIALAGSVVLFLPWLPGFLGQLNAGKQLQTALPGWSEVVSTTQLKALPLVVAKFLFGVSNVDINGPFIVIVGWITCAACLSITYAYKKKGFAQNSLPLLIWLVVPILTSWLVSFWVPVLQPKRVLFCLPALYLAIALIADYTFQSAKKSPFTIFQLYPRITSPAFILLVTMFIVNSISVAQYWLSPALQRENWRSLISEIEAKYPERSITLFAFPKPFAPWRWYSSEEIPALATGELVVTSENAVQIIKKSSDFDQVIMFDYLKDLSDPDEKLKNLLIEYGYKEIEVIDYPLIGFVRIYSKPEAVISYR
jgi:uncharacterized membrane protein